ncbi:MULTISPECIES: hypothetical protein [unclassified Pseudomonas]|uniref:hypothetical protein n=1 Tax=unclassified Pseudomonas TaxID=196821 RepID=UPI00244B7773|nr:MULTISPECIES: hypothetical protein [unclassified Pseudomonas]MDH0302517.1 hypothetical protein [Pseudomonas sp. GD04091]MDH1983764.1 hypothetical protein [Pseudomonas sp. GD03689]
MKTKTSLTTFYATVTLFTALDMAMVIAMIWYGLKVTGSAVLLGTTLCVATLVPYIVERVMARFGRVTLSMRRLVLTRLLIFATVGLLSLTTFIQVPVGFLLIAFLVGMTDYFTISTLEASNTKLVLAGKLSSDASSRLMQTSIQIGAFGGALLGGVVVDAFSLSTVLQGISLAAIGSLVLAFVLDERHQPQAGDGQAAQARTPRQAIPGKIVMLIVALGMIGFHIGAFNSLVPIVFQQLNDWSAAQFGIASGLAGLGAFSAAVLTRVRLPHLLCLVFIILADALIVFAQSTVLIGVATFCLGFSINYLRIALRKHLIEAAADNATADNFASQSAFVYLMLNGSAPMLLTLLASASVFGLEAARPLMICAALLLGLAALGWQLSSSRSPSVATE